MNHLIASADRNTHVRIVAMSLFCAFVFVAAMLGTRASDQNAGPARLEATVLKAGKPAIVTSQDVTKALR
jgi:hypothetical protein